MTLKQIVKQKGLTQKALTSELVKFKIYKYQQQISEWVNGLKIPDLKSAFYIAKILNISLDELTEGLFENG